MDKKSEAIECMNVIHQTLTMIGLCFGREESDEMEKRLIKLSAAITVYYRVPPLFVLFPYNKLKSYSLSKPPLSKIYDARDLVYELCDRWWRKKDIMVFVRAISDIVDLWV